jgi:hypothetical protein
MVRLSISKPSAVTETPGPAVACTASISFGLPLSRMSKCRTCPADVPMKRSSPRPSRASAVTTPRTLSGWSDSSFRLAPIRAFFSTVLWMTRSSGPTWATVTAPDSGAAVARRDIGRLASGSTAAGAPKTGCGRMCRWPSGNATSNATSRGITRPSEVPMT